jgi:hypothetical protein
LERNNAEAFLLMEAIIKSAFHKANRIRTAIKWGVAGINPEMK